MADAAGDAAGQDGEQSFGSSEFTASEDESSWISWYINLRGNEFFCAVDEDFIQDDFNLTGLSSMVPYFDYSLDVILDLDIPFETLSSEQQSIVETAAEVLYGLIHARYVLTARGMQKMADKYIAGDFGRCPRVYCKSQPVLPVCLSDVPRVYTVNIYCPSCQEIYYPRSSKHANLDGAYFGTTFAHLFLLSHPEHIPPRSGHAYVPRIYGFRIYKESPYYRQRSSARLDTGGNGPGTASAIESAVAAESNNNNNNLDDISGADKHAPDLR